MTYRFEQSEVGPPFVLECRPSQVSVHAAGAQLEPDAMCDCDELKKCDQSSVWRPTTTKPMSALACAAKAGIGWARLPGVLLPAEPLLFTAEPGLERMRGWGDCPIKGLREARQPTIDWSVFPEGTTALRVLRANLASEAESTRTSLVVQRRGSTVTVTTGAQRFTTDSLAAAARSGDHSFALSCWKESRTVHSKDVRFELPDAAECDGGDEPVKSRAPVKATLLACRALVDGAATDTVYPFVPGRVIEDLDINADCTMRRALRFIPGIDAEAFDPHR